MSSPAARLALRLFGAFLLFVGGGWAGQGLDLIPGSAMSRDRAWFFTGLVVAVVGLVLIVLGFRPIRGRRAP